MFIIHWPSAPYVVCTVAVGSGGVGEKISADSSGMATGMVADGAARVTVVAASAGTADAGGV
ncbi:MAG: hypothetical protein WEA35_02710, partial [Candidatus Nanopelagicales bacterium]